MLLLLLSRRSRLRLLLSRLLLLPLLSLTPRSLLSFLRGLPERPLFSRFLPWLGLRPDVRGDKGRPGLRLRLRPLLAPALLDWSPLLKSGLADRDRLLLLLLFLLLLLLRVKMGLCERSRFRFVKIGLLLLLLLLLGLERRRRRSGLGLLRPLFGLRLLVGLRLMWRC